jgi:hypothetical protein
MRNISRTQQGKLGQSDMPNNNAEANGVLPLFGAVLNKLQQLGIQCTAVNDDGAGALVITVHGARVDVTPDQKKRFTMRSSLEGETNGHP